MAWLKQQPLRILYVAGSAREFPVKVRDWLSTTNHRAVASPNVYDALALMAKGRRPTVLLVSMASVDFTELAFFDHVRHLTRETQVYVAGEEQYDEKIRLACQRGAREFSEAAIESDLVSADEPITLGGADRLVAGRLDPAGDRTPTAQPGPVKARPDVPSVRLVTSESIEEDDEDETVVPVPWIPNPERPQRTPPSARAAEPEPTESKDDQKGEQRSESTPPSSVTAEELAALLGRKEPPPPTGRAKEQ